MPRIWPASVFTSSTERASLTPPPLPRPPAWICAFTTHTGPPSVFAACTASSTEKHGTAARRRHAELAEQLLGLVLVDLHAFLPERTAVACAPIPAWVVAPHGLAPRVERVAVVELERLRAVVLVVAASPASAWIAAVGNCDEDLGEMGAAGDVAEAFLHALPEAAREVEADELLRVVRRDRARTRRGTASPRCRTSASTTASRRSTVSRIHMSCTGCRPARTPLEQRGSRTA